MSKKTEEYKQARAKRKKQARIKAKEKFKYGTDFMANLTAGTSLEKIFQISQQMEKVTRADREALIEDIRQKLQHPDIDKPGNISVRDGLNEAIYVLDEGITDLNHTSPHLKSVQSRGIVQLAIGYNRSELIRDAILNVPIKNITVKPL